MIAPSNMQVVITGQLETDVFRDFNPPTLEQLIHKALEMPGLHIELLSLGALDDNSVGISFANTHQYKLGAVSVMLGAFLHVRADRTYTINANNYIRVRGQYQSDTGIPHGSYIQPSLAVVQRVVELVMLLDELQVS